MVHTPDALSLCQLIVIQPSIAKWALCRVIKVQSLAPNCRRPCSQVHLTFTSECPSSSSMLRCPFSPFCRRPICSTHPLISPLVALSYCHRMKAAMDFSLIVSSSFHDSSPSRLLSTYTPPVNLCSSHHVRAQIHSPTSPFLKLCQIQSELPSARDPSTSR